MNGDVILSRFGFRWGQANVTRKYEHGGLKVITIKTPYRELEISVSAAGRSVRVWRDGKELT